MFGEAHLHRYAHRVLAEGLHASTSPRKTPFLVVGGLAVIAAAVALVVVLSGGSDGPLAGIGGNDEPQVPSFEFDAADPAAISTSFAGNPEAPPPSKAQLQAAEKKATIAAQPAAAAATAALDDFYTRAFLDPANWQEGVYDSAFEGFSSQARAEAEAEIDVLTAGTGTSDLTSITPLPSTVRTKVLLDPDGVPTSVIGIVKFRAKGKGEAGTHIFDSRGQFFFEKTGGQWTVVGYSVSRKDKVQEPKPTTSAPSASAS
jgi:hypothetical protein